MTDQVHDMNDPDPLVLDSAIHARSMLVSEVNDEMCSEKTQFETEEESVTITDIHVQYNPDPPPECCIEVNMSGGSDLNSAKKEETKLSEMEEKCMAVLSHISKFKLTGIASGHLIRLLKLFESRSDQVQTLSSSNLGSLIGPRQANLVFIAYASSEGSGEPAHPRSLARTSAARSYKQWVKRNLQTKSQIPGPSEWLGMRS